MGADAGAFTLTGQLAEFHRTYVLAATGGGFVLAGQDASLLVGRLLSADAGAFVLTGQDATLLYDRAIAANANAFVLAGQDATLLAVRILSADAAAFVFTGADATLTVVLAGVEAAAITLLLDRPSLEIGYALPPRISSELPSSGRRVVLVRQDDVVVDRLNREWTLPRSPRVVTAEVLR